MDEVICPGPRSYQVVELGLEPGLLTPEPACLSTQPSLAPRLWDDTSPGLSFEHLNLVSSGSYLKHRACVVTPPCLCTPPVVLPAPSFLSGPHKSLL